MRKFLGIGIYGLAVLLLTACGADKYVKKGDQFYAIGEYFEAAAQYRKAYMHMGVRVGVIVLIVNGALKFLKGMKRTPLAIILAVAMFCLAVFTEISVIYLMLGSIGISIIAVALTHIIRKRSLISTMTKCGGDYERKRSDGNLCPDAMLAVNMQAAETELCESLPDSGEEEKTCDNAEQTDNSSETETAEHDDADKPDGVETDDVQTANTESNDDTENGVAENAENKEDGE